MENRPNTKKKATTTSKSNTTAKNKETHSYDFSNSEESIKNIELVASNYGIKWVKEKGFAVGIENHQLTKWYKTLNEAAEKIGYRIERDEDGDDVQVKIGGTDWEQVANIVRILVAVHEENTQLALEQTIENLKKQENG